MKRRLTCNFRSGRPSLDRSSSASSGSSSRPSWSSQTGRCRAEGRPGCCCQACSQTEMIKERIWKRTNRKDRQPRSRWKYQFSYDHWSQASLAQPAFRWVKLFGEWWVLLLSNLGVKPTWLLRETGNSAPEADPRIPPNKQTKKWWQPFFNF